MAHIKINKPEFMAWAKAQQLTLAQISRDIGRGNAFMSRALHNGELTKSVFDLLEKLYGPIPAVVKSETRAEPRSEGPYTVDLEVRPDRVRVTIRHMGEEMYSGYSRVKGPDELDLIQAISYAAHFCYKKAEQKKLENE